MSKTLTTCVSCKGDSFSTILENYRDLMWGCPGQWNLIECNHCGIILTVPLLDRDQLLNYYPPGYSPYQPSGSLRTHFPANLIRNVAMLPYTIRFGSTEWMEIPFGRRHLIEVGCGRGEFLKVALSLGWKCWGIDVSPLAVEATKKNVPEATVELGSFDEINIREQFDFINMSCVLEHLPDPCRALRQCFLLLSSGGKIRLIVPNIDSIEAKILGRYWSGLDVPRHLYHLSEGVIRRILSDVGFCDICIRPAMFASSLSESLILMLPDGLRRRVLHSRLAHIAYLALVFPASVSYLLGNRGVIEVKAQKP